MLSSVCKLLLAAGAAALLGSGGCGGPDGPAGPVTVASDGAKPSLDTSDLALLLKQCVREGVLVEPALRKHQAPLEAYLARLAVTGPTTTPSLLPGQDHRIAYWYNARAAWSMKLSLMADCREVMSRRCLEDRPFSLDGRQMTLAQIDAALAQDADWRVAAAAPSIRMTEPALPETPFQPADVRQQVARRFQDYLADWDRFQIDLERKEIIFSAALWAARGKIVDLYRRQYGGSGASPVTALLPHAQGRAHRRLQDALGYRVVPQSDPTPTAVAKE